MDINEKRVRYGAQRRVSLASSTNPDLPSFTLAVMHRLEICPCERLLRVSSAALISRIDFLALLWTLAICRAEFRNREQQREVGRNPRDVAGLSLTPRVPRDSGWERNHGWIMIMPGN